MFIKQKIKILAVLPFFLFGLFVAREILAVAQMTQPIVVENARRGQIISEKMIIQNNETKEALIYLEAEGNIAEWTRFYQKDKPESFVQSILIAPRTLEHNIFAEFIVPDDISNGVYEGQVSVIKKPDNAKSTTTTGVSISQKIARAVKITVIDEEIIDFSAEIIPEKYDYVSNESLKMRLIYRNNGNIALSPQAQVKIKSGGNTFYNAIHPYPENEEAIKPLERREIVALEIPLGNLKQGRYVVEIDLLNKGEIIEQEVFKFSIGKIQGVFAVVEKIGGKNSLALIFIFFFIFLLITLTVGVFFWKKQSLKYNEDNQEVE